MLVTAVMVQITTWDYNKLFLEPFTVSADLLTDIMVSLLVLCHVIIPCMSRFYCLLCVVLLLQWFTNLGKVLTLQLYVWQDVMPCGHFMVGWPKHILCHMLLYLRETF